MKPILNSVKISTIILVLLAITIISCENDVIDYFSRDKGDSSFVSSKSKELGIEAYKILKHSTYKFENKNVDEFNYIIYHHGKKNSLNVIFGEGNATIKIKTGKSHGINKISELTLDKANMFLSISDATGENFLYLRHRYASDKDYQEARRIFDENADYINLVLASSLDLIDKFDIKFNEELIGEKVKEEIEHFRISDSKMRMGICPEGTFEVQSSRGASSRSSAEYLANMELQGDCTTGRCIGCYVTVGVDCACLWGDLACLCVATGCGC